MLLPFTKDTLKTQCFRLYQPTLDKLERIFNKHGVYFLSDPWGTAGNMEEREWRAQFLLKRVKDLQWRERLEMLKKEVECGR